MVIARKALRHWVVAKDRYLWTLAALLGAVLVALLDFATGPYLAFSVFYLIPVAAAAWYGSRGAGLAVATLSGVLWFVAEALSSPAMGGVVLLWNSFSRLLIFAALALVLARLQKERAELERVNLQLAQQNRDLDAFAGRVAHDLRNAVAPVSLAVPLLRVHATDPQKISLLADRVDASCRKSTLIIDSLLALAKAEQPLPETCSAQLLPTVREVVRELDDTITQHTIEVLIEIEPQLRVGCAPGLLHIVMANLIGNAVKYLCDHSQPRCVRVSAGPHERCVQIVVADNGPGIPHDERTRVFEPFYRGRQAGSDGTGIGLATVKRIVSSQGGTVTLDPDPAGGAVFRVVLPAPCDAADRLTRGNDT